MNVSKATITRWANNTSPGEFLCNLVNLFRVAQLSLDDELGLAEIPSIEYLEDLDEAELRAALSRIRATRETADVLARKCAKLEEVANTCLQEVSRRERAKKTRDDQKRINQEFQLHQLSKEDLQLLQEYTTNALKEIEAEEEAAESAKDPVHRMRWSPKSNAHQEHIYKIREINNTLHRLCRYAQPAKWSNAATEDVQAKLSGCLRDIREFRLELLDKPSELQLSHLVDLLYFELAKPKPLKGLIEAIPQLKKVADTVDYELDSIIAEVHKEAYSSEASKHELLDTDDPGYEEKLLQRQESWAEAEYRDVQEEYDRRCNFRLEEEIEKRKAAGEPINQSEIHSRVHVEISESQIGERLAAKRAALHNIIQKRLNLAHIRKQEKPGDRDEIKSES